MSSAAKTILAFGAYVMVTGATIAVAPNSVLALFGFPPAQEIWIRVFGMQVLVVGFYYCAAALGEATPFFRATLYGRGAMTVFFVVLVGLGLMGPMLLLFGVAEVVGAVATAVALRREAGRGEALAPVAVPHARK